MAKVFWFGATVVGGLFLTAVSLDASPLRNSGVRVRAPRSNNVHVTVDPTTSTALGSPQGSPSTQPTGEPLTAPPGSAATSGGLVVDPGPVTATAVATAIAGPIITTLPDSSSRTPGSGSAPELGGGA